MQLTPGRLALRAARSHPGESAFDHALAAVDRARELATEDHARFVVVILPTKEEIYLPAHHEAVPPLTANWVAALRAGGLDCPDLTGPLRHHAGGGPLYYQVDGHANAAGNRVIGASVTDYPRAHRSELGLSPAR